MTGGGALVNAFTTSPRQALKERLAVGRATGKRDMTTKKHIRDAIMLARDLGVVDARVEKGGKHPHLLGTAPNGEPLRYTLPGSPSDGRRGARNLEADLRRACRTQDADDDVQQARAEERNHRQRH